MKKKTLRLLFAALLAISLFTIAGCGDDDKKEAKSTTTQEQPTEQTTQTTETQEPPTETQASPQPTKKEKKKPVSKDLKERPKISAPGGEPPTKLEKEDIVKGDGKEAKSGDTIEVAYVGALFSNGQEFDASWNRGGEPFSFQLGAGQVIPGWDQGVAGMKVGGRRKLTIPPDLAYGPQGSGPIGPNETLIFIVDLKAVK